MSAPNVPSPGREQSCAEVKQRILAARDAHPNGVLAFDCDGTLWSGDIGEDTFAARIDGMLAELGPLDRSAAETLATLARERSIVAGDGVQTARALFEGYTRGEVSEELMCEIMAWVYAGWTRTELYAFVDRVISTRALATRVHQEASAIGAWAAEVGIPVYIVSASPLGVIERSMTVLGWSAKSIVAATPLVANERIQAAVERPIPYGPGKVARLNERTGGLPVLAAFGDNVFDLALLQSASVPVAVRPKPRLRERFVDHPEIVVLTP